MPRDLEAPPEPTPTPKRKEERMELRLDPDLAERARQKAQQRGWTLSAVMRALLALWVDEDVIAPEEVGRYADRAPKQRPPTPPTSE